MSHRLCGEAVPLCPGTRRRRRARDSGVSSAATDLPGRERSEGKRIAIEEEQDRRPDVKAAGCRGEDGNTTGAAVTQRPLVTRILYGDKLP